MTDRVAAHDARETRHFVWHYPEHEVRAGPHRAAFEAVKRRLKQQHLWRCVACGSTEQVELHHSHVEHALQQGVDIQRLNELLGLHLDDASFADWIVSPGNLETLCVACHRGTTGVHMLPAPAWEAWRVWRRDLPPPAELAPASTSKREEEEEEQR